MSVTEVQFRVYTGEDYDKVLEQVRGSPGWLEMVIIDVEAWAEGDPVGEMTAYLSKISNSITWVNTLI